MASTGQAVALNYGYNWITGYKLNARTIENSGNINLDYTRVGFWLLGEGEMDGLIEMWDTGLSRLLYQNENDDPTTLHFHAGCDAPPAQGGYPASTGGDQMVDLFWNLLAPGLQPLYYHRWAYYAIKLKQLINSPPNTHQDDASVWADVNPVGLWRGIRCRTFDSSGALTGYAFTRNPAWHTVDLLCRRKLFREYGLDPMLGADDLPSAVRQRFDWAALADTAAYFDELLPNGQPRFAGDYSFSQRTSLQSCLTQILTVSRSFLRERAGAFSLVPDRQRASVFTFSRDNADGLVATDADLHTAPNQYIAHFRDLQVPAFASIEQIDCPDHQSPVVTTVNPHSASAGDYIAIGNTGTIYDGNWIVASVPGGDYVNTMTLRNRGSNYPVSVGAGGLMGFRFSRFKPRSPEFHHHQHQYARGAIGVGLPRQRNKVAVETDFANATWDQVARVSSFQRSTALGPDVVPYVAPKRLALHVPLFAPDAAGSGAVAIQIEPGDVVAIDDTLSTTHAGLYEVMSADVTLTGSQAAQGSQRAAIAGGIDLTLRPYDDANYPDISPTEEPGWPDVPGLPGHGGSFTRFPLADGEAVFFTGSAADGDSFLLPDGYHAPNFLCWASPQGFIEGNQQLHYITDCDAYPTRKLALIYNDGSGSTWRGDVNYAGVAWNTRSSAAVTTLNAMNYVELTLRGGEKLLFGKGILAAGDQVSLPAGYQVNKAIALAFPKVAYQTGNPTHGVAAWVLSDGTLHHVNQDGEGHHWEGPGQAFVCSILNNNGGWRDGGSGNGWRFLPLPNGQVLALMGQSIQPHAPTIQGASVPLALVTGTAIAPLPGVTSTTLQTMTGPNGFDIVDHPAHGVKACYIDADLNSYCTFEDGEGNVWSGSAGVFGLLCEIQANPLNGNPIPDDPTTWAGSPGSPSGGAGGGGGTGSGGGGTGPGGGATTPAQPSPNTSTQPSSTTGGN